MKCCWLTNGQGFGKFKLVWTSGTWTWKAWASSIFVCFSPLFLLGYLQMYNQSLFDCLSCSIYDVSSCCCFLCSGVYCILVLQVTYRISLYAGNFTKTIFKELFHPSLVTWRASSAWTCIITTSLVLFLPHWENWNL